MKNFINLNFAESDFEKIDNFDTISSLRSNDRFLKNQIGFSRGFFKKDEAIKIHDNLIQLTKNKGHKFSKNKRTVHGNVTYIYPNKNIGVNLSEISLVMN